MNDSQALAKCVTCLLDSTTASGIWGDFQVDWDPIITALTCRLLLSCGLSLDSEWYVRRQDYTRCSLRDSLKWLNNAIRPDGSFGTDFWDALQLGIVIETFQLQKSFSAYPTLTNHLLVSLKNEDYLHDPSQWQGPGFIAAGIQYLRLRHLSSEADSHLNRLIKLQNRKGFWNAPSDPSGSPIISPVWHTAQSVMALAVEPENNRFALTKACDWLRHTQDKSGAWVSVQQYKIYFTSYAILAFVAAHQENDPSVRKAIDYLKSQMGEDGKCSDLGGTLMCGMALHAVVGRNFDHDLTLVDYLLARKNCTRAEALQSVLAERDAELVRLRSDVQRFESKYGDADVVFTKKQLFIASMAGLLLTALGTVAGVYALNTALKPTPPAVATPTPPPPSVSPTPTPVVPLPANTQRNESTQERGSLPKPKAQRSR